MSRPFLLASFLLLFLLAPIAFAQDDHQRLDGWCETGTKRVVAGGITSTTTVQQSFPACTITVYDAGTLSLASICSDHLTPTCTPKSNPFQANASDGYWFFYGAPGRYDIRYSGGTSPNTIPTPFTRADAWIASGGGGSSFPQADYVTLSLNSSLTNERVLTAGTNITLVDTGPNGTITINSTGGGGNCPGTSTNTQVIYNNSGACAGIANAISLDGTTLRVTSGDFITDLRDTNHNKWLVVNPLGSAVNEITISNAASTNSPKIESSGTDSNINLDFDAKGTGALRWRQKAYSIPVALVDAATITTDASLSNRFDVTLGGNRILANPTNADDGQQMVFTITQDSTGGRTLTYDTKFVFGAEISTCVIGPTANAKTFFSVIYRSSTDKFYIVACVTNYL